MAELAQKTEHRTGDGRWLSTADLLAENDRLREAVETTEEWAYEQGYDGLAARLRAALEGERP